jgi:hypothetical protein
MSQNEMIRLVEEDIEPNSPVGKGFGKEGNVGEGIVVTFWFKDELYRFKVKGEKHSNSKVKTLKPVDEEKENAKIEFANYATPAWRLEQMWQNIYGIENEKSTPNVKDTGIFLKALMGDIVKEEIDVLAERGLEPKDIAGYVNAIGRKWFNEQLDKFIILL